MEDVRNGMRRERKTRGMEDLRGKKTWGMEDEGNKIKTLE
jgi:hypothetical protein